MSIVNGCLVVGTMCHCDDPEACGEDGDHWEFFVDPTNFDEEDGTMSSARRLNEAEMRAIVALVEKDGQS